MKKIVNLLGQKKKGDKEVLMTMVLIGVGVVVALVFRDQIQTIVGTMLTSFSTKIGTMFS